MLPGVFITSQGTASLLITHVFDRFLRSTSAVEERPTRNSEGEQADVWFFLRKLHFGEYYVSKISRLLRIHLSDGTKLLTGEDAARRTISFRLSITYSRSLVMRASEARQPLIFDI